jgi:CBS domain-containing protein
MPGHVASTGRRLGRKATRRGAMAGLLEKPAVGFEISWRALFGISPKRPRRLIIKAKDVMTRRVITIAVDASIREALQLMLQHNISGLPVIDKTGNLAGIVTEGDFLRRSETGTERKRPRWLEFLLGPGRLAADYAHTHAHKVNEVITWDVQTITEDAPLDEIVALMEKHRIKRVSVVRGNELVGIVRGKLAPCTRWCCRRNFCGSEG